MSSNMGTRTAKESFHGFGVAGQLAVGMQATNTCVNCGMTKASKQHKLIADKCSKALQRKYRSEV